MHARSGVPAPEHLALAFHARHRLPSGHMPNHYFKCTVRVDDSFRVLNARITRYSCVYMKRVLRFSRLARFRNSR